MDRTLTDAQVQRLEVLEGDFESGDPGEYKVVGWLETGPLVRRPDGGIRRVNPSGRLSKPKVEVAA